MPRTDERESRFTKDEPPEDKMISQLESIVSALGRLKFAVWCVVALLAVIAVEIAVRVVQG